MNKRKYDIIVWGASGFTGKLSCEYLKQNYSHLKWAIAGRNESKLNELKKELNLSSDVLIGDIENKESLNLIFGNTKVVISMAGPFAKIGSPIIASCIDVNTHYCDITGEAPWVRNMIDVYHEEAINKKLKIVNCCAFDCVPSDLGCHMIVNEMKKKNLTPIEVKLMPTVIKGGASGGTIASVINMLESLPTKTLMESQNPFYLANRDSITNKQIQPTDDKIVNSAHDNWMIGYDKVTKKWTTGYIMQSIDTRVINRSNSLSNYSYGRNFLYTESMAVPGFIAAVITTAFMGIASMLIMFPLSRYLLKKFVLPSPGQGPSLDMLNNGYFKMKLWGKGNL